MFVPTVGSIYFFSFLPEYAKWNGTYCVSKRMTFQECVDEDVNLVDEWYTPCGVADTQYKADLNTLYKTDIMKLVNPETMDSKHDFVFAPLIYINKVPDHNVKRYYSLAVGYHIGVTADPQRITEVMEVMKEHMQAATGVMTDPKLFEISTSWMTDQQYADVEKERDQTKKKLFNYYSENVRLRNENSSLRTKIRYYEEKFLAISKPIITPEEEG